MIKKKPYFATAEIMECSYFLVAFLSEIQCAVFNYSALEALWLILCATFLKVQKFRFTRSPYLWGLYNYQAKQPLFH
jgi:hypothetical protein